MATSPALISGTGSSTDRDVDQELERLRDLIPLPAASRLIPSAHGGQHINPATLWRWVNRGVKAPDGRRVKLRAARMGHAWMTTRRWVLEFVDAVTSTNTEEPATVPVSTGVPSARPRTPLSPARRRAAEAAQAELQRLGWGA